MCFMKTQTITTDPAARWLLLVLSLPTNSATGRMRIWRNLKALGTFGHQVVHRGKCHFASAIPRTLRHLLGHFQRLRHGEGVLACEHWIRLTEKRLLKAADSER